MFAPPITKPASSRPPASPFAAPTRFRPAFPLQRKCDCGAGAMAAADKCEQCARPGLGLERALAVGASDDPLEREADRVAEQVLAARPQPDFGRAPISIRRDSPASAPQPATVAQSVHDALASTGTPLSPRLRLDMEARFGRDFSSVRLHQGASAERSSRALGARAYTLGSDIVFAAGQFAPDSAHGRRLLAHELAHVVQQSGAGARIVRRDIFVGAAGTTAKDKDRPLVAGEGPMQHTLQPGGTIVPNTESMAQNCAGDSTGIAKWINWPDLGLEAPNVAFPASVRGDWAKANQFVPSGCTRVNCSGVDTHHSRCNPGELDTIVFLYRWPVKIPVQGGLQVQGTQSDFHMIGRDAELLPSGWHSKMDKREKVVDIRDPLQSLHDAYPHTKGKDREISKLCFCCTPAMIKTK